MCGCLQESLKACSRTFKHTYFASFSESHINPFMEQPIYWLIECSTIHLQVTIAHDSHYI